MSLVSTFIVGKLKRRGSICSEKASEDERSIAVSFFGYVMFNILSVFVKELLQIFCETVILLMLGFIKAAKRIGIAIYSVI